MGRKIPESRQQMQNGQQMDNNMDPNILKDQWFDHAVIDEQDQFIIKFAETEAEVEAVLRLRYRVFNQEQGKGLDAANAEGIDRDEFDDHCLHLMIVDKTSMAPVGTYRIHFGTVAKATNGFYSAREYRLSGVDAIIDDCIEVGRSCVAPEFRSGAVVALLWSGIARVLRKSRYRFLMGCVSLETEDPAVGWALYRHFQAQQVLSPLLRAQPQEKFQLRQPDEAAVADWLNRGRELEKQIPPLFKGYLRLGTKVCGEPAMDYEFGTIDFMILLDVTTVPERYWRHFSADGRNQSVVSGMKA